MVLELLLRDATKKPLYLFFAGIVFTTVGILLASILFTESPSLPLVIFMSIPCIYMFTDKLRETSREQTEADTVEEVFDANSDIMEMYLYMFLGMMFAITIWFSLMPENMSSAIFSEQLFNLRAINVAARTFSAVSSNVFMAIAINNIRLVLIFALLSFLFGAGAVFILSWNATVVGVAMGIVIKKIQAEGASLPFALFKGLPIGVSYYILHLIPEVVAYFLAAISGALISSGMTRYGRNSEKATKLFLISAALLSAAIIIILLAAGVEISISHMIQLRYSV